MILDRNQLRLAHLIVWGRQVLAEVAVAEVMGEVPDTDLWDLPEEDTQLELWDYSNIEMNFILKYAKQDNN